MDPADDIDPNLCDYAMARSRCCDRVKDSDFDVAGLISESAKRLRTKSFAQVQASALLGNAEDTLELGLR